MSSVTGGLSRFKNPDYTGENRCFPCTIVNLVIAFAIALCVELVAIALEVGTLGWYVAQIVFVVGVIAIYFRGYLVPGTPELTKRYFPPWLLRAFGKQESVDGLTGIGDAERDDDLNVERTLLDANVLTEAEQGGDLRLTDEFELALDTQLDDIDGEEAGLELLSDVLDVRSDKVRRDRHSQAFRVYRDRRSVGVWESYQAFLADVAAGTLLRDRIADWDGMTTGQRGQLLNGLRLFLETCPDCGGDLSFGIETVESCCSTRDVATVTCDDCEALLFESDDVA